MLNKFKRAVAYRLSTKKESFLWKHHPLEWTLRSKINIRIRNQAEWVIYNDIFVDGEYDAAIQQALNAVPSGRPIYILDLGANVGFFALRVLDLISRSEFPNRPLKLFMVEGSPATYRELKSRLSSQNFNTNDWIVVQGLVGKRSGSAKIQESAFHVMNAVSDNPASSGTTAQFIDLEKLILPTPHFDLIKCDIEGSELSFIENYTDLLRNTQSAVFEFHPLLCDTKKCVSALATAGLVNHKLLMDGGSYSLNYFKRD